MRKAISKYFWCETFLWSSPIYSTNLVEEIIIDSYYLLLPLSLELEKWNKKSLLKRTESKLLFWKLSSSEDQTEHTSSELNLWSRMEYYTNWNIIKGCKIKQLPWQKSRYETVKVRAWVPRSSLLCASNFCVYSPELKISLEKWL